MALTQRRDNEREQGEEDEVGGRCVKKDESRWTCCVLRLEGGGGAQGGVLGDGGAIRLWYPP